MTLNLDRIEGSDKFHLDPFKSILCIHDIPNLIQAVRERDEIIRGLKDEISGLHDELAGESI